MRDSKLKKLEELLDRDESEKLDFKKKITLSTDKEKYELAKDISAFANTQGGVIIYGKEDRKEGGRIVGIEAQTYDSDQMHQIVTQRCNPPPLFYDEMIFLKGKQLVFIEIPRSKLKPHEVIQNREVWVRRGATSDRATQIEREKMSNNRKPLEAKLQREGIPEEETENVLRVLVIRIGRWYMGRKYGDLKHPMSKEIMVLIAIGILLWSPLLYSLYEISGLHVVPGSFELTAFILLAVLGGIFLIVSQGIPKLRCPDCGRQFAVRRKKHIRVRSEIIHKTSEKVTREVTYQNLYACDFCKFKNKKFEAETETLSVN
jgi:hypothetical protein